MSTITAVNSVFLLKVPGLYDSDVQIQGYAADDAFATENQVINETSMGIDGRLSGGYVHAPVTVSVSLQADSGSIAIFDTWASAMKAAKEVLTCSVTIELPGPGLSYSLTRGFLTNYTPISDVRKTLQPRKFSLVFEKVDATPI